MLDNFSLEMGQFFMEPEKYNSSWEMISFSILTSPAGIGVAGNHFSLDSYSTFE